MKRQRTTHSDLANLLDELAAKLSTMRPEAGLSDPATLQAVRAAAEALYRQDLRVGELNVSLRGSIEDQRAALLRKRV